MSSLPQKPKSEDVPWELYYNVASEAVDRVLSEYARAFKGTRYDGMDVMDLLRRSYPTGMMSLKKIEQQMMDQTTMPYRDYQLLGERLVNGYSQLFQKLNKTPTRK